MVAIVDDDPEIVVALTEWLGMTGYRSVGFSSAESMVDALVPNSDSTTTIELAGGNTVRLVGAILDVMLPGLSGFQLATRLRVADRELSIVLISAGTSAAKGLARPWAVAVDGNDNVWVSNLVSDSTGIVQLCGVRMETWAPGMKAGDAVSPPGGLCRGRHAATGRHRHRACR